MDTVHKRDLPPAVFAGYSLIGRQHEIFDQICRHIMFIGTYLNRMPCLTENDLALREIEIDGAAILSVFPDFFRQFRHFKKHRYEIAALLCQCFVLAAKDLFDLGVGHPAVDMDHGLHQFVGQALTRSIKGHQTA